MSVVAGTVVIESPNAIVTISRSFTHIPKRTALLPSFWTSASTIALTRAGSAFGARSPDGTFEDCSPIPPQTPQKEIPMTSQSLVFIRKRFLSRRRRNVNS
jgi:hypothetical protein